MPDGELVLRTLHDAGLAVWFGGSLAGAVGFNGGANDVSDKADRFKVATAAWARWTPVAAAAIGVHLVGAAGLTVTNADRIRTQDGVAAASIGKAAVTVLALGATAVSGWLGQKDTAAVASPDHAGGVPAEGGVKPSADTPPDVAARQQQLRILQWVIPSLTGVLVALTAQQGELQRPAQVTTGRIRKSLR